MLQFIERLTAIKIIFFIVRLSLKKLDHFFGIPEQSTSHPKMSTGCHFAILSLDRNEILVLGKINILKSSTIYYLLIFI
jgi:hypothetical protein